MFSNYFVNINDEFGNWEDWEEDPLSLYITLHHSKLTEQINLFDNHWNIKLIMYKYQNPFYFALEFVSINQMLKDISHIYCNKSWIGGIPAKII